MHKNTNILMLPLTVGGHRLAQTCNRILQVLIKHKILKHLKRQKRACEDTNAKLKRCIYFTKYNHTHSSGPYIYTHDQKHEAAVLLRLKLIKGCATLSGVCYAHED